MKKILLPTDFSESARKAVAYALNLYGDKNCEFLLLNAFKPPHSAGMLISIDDFVKKDAEKALKDELKYIKENFNYQKDNIKIRAGHGFARDVIIAVADEQTMDLVIMGTKGASGLKEAFIGSNAAYVARRSRVPVITVPDDVVVESPKKIVLAVDFNSELNVETLAPIITFSGNFNAHIHILHVLTGEEKEEGYQAKKDEVANFFKGTEHTFHFINSKEVVEGISSFVENNEADILALVPMKIKFLDNILQRSVTRKMETRSELPIFALCNIAN